MKGHEQSLLLNEAYRSLIRMKQNSGAKQKWFGGNYYYSGRGCSAWNGPVRSQALFVDENRCIGNCIIYKSVSAVSLITVDGMHFEFYLIVSYLTL